MIHDPHLVERTLYDHVLHGRSCPRYSAESCEDNDADWFVLPEARFDAVVQRAQQARARLIAAHSRRPARAE